MSDERALDPRTSRSLLPLPPICEDPAIYDLQLSEEVLPHDSQDHSKEKPPSHRNLPALGAEGGLTTENDYHEAIRKKTEDLEALKQGLLH